MKKHVQQTFETRIMTPLVLRWHPEQADTCSASSNPNPTPQKLVGMLVKLDHFPRDRGENKK